MPDETPTYVGPDKWVRVIGEREDGSKTYAAGPKSKKYEAGQIVPNNYAKSVLGAVNFRNKVRGMLSNIEEIDPDRRTERQQAILEGGYSEAQKAQSEFIQLTKELNQAQRAENEARIVSLEKEIADLREALGSP